MTRADQWLGNLAPNAQPGNIEVRAMDTARLIAARPVTIVVNRFVVNAETGLDEVIQLPPQTVRVELVQNTYGAKETRDSLIQQSRQYVFIAGILGHPTIPDTDLKRADQFLWQGLMYEVIDFIDTVPGRLLASGQVTP